MPRLRSSVASRVRLCAIAPVMLGPQTPYRSRDPDKRRAIRPPGLEEQHRFARLDERIRRGTTRRARPEDHQTLILEPFSGDLERGTHGSQRDGTGALHIVVEDPHPVPVLLEDASGIPWPEVLEM